MDYVPLGYGNLETKFYSQLPPFTKLQYFGIPAAPARSNAGEADYPVPQAKALCFWVKNNSKTFIKCEIAYMNYVWKLVNCDYYF